MAEEFKEGDQVLLKSGGPVMTIEYIGVDPDLKKEMASCMWFAGVTLMRGDFPATVLKRASS